MTELTNPEENHLLKYCMKSEYNTWLALAIGQIYPNLQEETMMTELTDEEKKFLVDYCLKPGNTRLALAISQIRPKLREKIVSSFLKKLDKSVREKLNSQWCTCVSDPKTIMKEQEETSIYVMTTKKRGIEIQIHLALYKGVDLFVGTPVGEGDWPEDDLVDFLKCGDRKLNKNKWWHWWFKPEKEHMSIKSVEALSTLNDGQKSEYFTAELVHFAEAISKALEARR